MATQKERRRIQEQMAEEKSRRDRERREFQERQELEGLKRAFKRLDKKNDGKIDTQEIGQELRFLEYKVTKEELEEFIWEVDDDDDHAVDWEEFKTAFYRARDDKTGYEPRKLYYLTEFTMADKDSSGSIDLEVRLQRFPSRLDPSQAECNAVRARRRNSSRSSTRAMVRRRRMLACPSTLGRISPAVPRRSRSQSLSAFRSKRRGRTDGVPHLCCPR